MGKGDGEAREEDVTKAKASVRNDKYFASKSEKKKRKENTGNEGDYKNKIVSI